MNITKEKIDEINALLTVKVEKEDYQETLNKTLEDYRKKANMPGFRKGKVPMGIIRKQYGQAILGDELNRLVSKGLYDYIDEQDFEILGNPLPKNDIEIKGDFNNPDEFEFVYEIGIAPDVEVSLSKRNRFDYTMVKVDKELIDKQVEDLTRRYGALEAGEKVGEKDMILCQLVELNDDESIKEGGVMNDNTVSMEFVKDEKTQKALLGKKAGDKVIVDPLKISNGKHDCSHMLGITEEEVDNVSNKFQMTINEIKVMKPAELNQELFDKLFPAGEVTSEEELRKRVEDDMKEMFGKDSDRILIRRVSNYLVDKLDIKLPDEFLKRWIKASQQGGDKQPLTDEEIEADYSNYGQSLRWQLIQNSIFKANDIKVTQEEAVEHTKKLLVKQYAQYGLPAPEDKELEQSAQQVLANQQEAQQIYDLLGEQKMIHFFKETVKLNEEEVDYDEFVKIAKDVNA